MHKGYKHTPETKAKMSAAAKLRVGSKHNRWKGDEAKERSIRARGHRVARALYPIKGNCQVCKKSPAQARHHKDENPHNNSRSNILMVCISCHSRIHYPEAGPSGFGPRRRRARG